MKTSSPFGFYALLTNPLRGYEYLTELLVDYGIAFVQLRMKDTPEDLIEPVALKLRKITAGSKTRFIINDSPALAVKVGADGVHVGQNDMAYDEVRKIVGENSIVGISTHNPDQTISACKLSPDYIGMGPVYATPTKKIPDPVIGINGLKEMLKEATVPGVAIGGIDLSNLRDVLEAGARNFCMVRQFTRSGDPEKVLKEILKIYGEFDKR